MQKRQVGRIIIAPDAADIVDTLLVADVQPMQQKEQYSRILLVLKNLSLSVTKHLSRKRNDVKRFTNVVLNVLPKV